MSHCVNSCLAVVDYSLKYGTKMWKYIEFWSHPSIAREWIDPMRAHTAYCISQWHVGACWCIDTVQQRHGQLWMTPTCPVPPPVTFLPPSLRNGVAAVCLSGFHFCTTWMMIYPVISLLLPHSWVAFILLVPHIWVARGTIHTFVTNRSHEEHASKLECLWFQSEVCVLHFEKNDR